MELAVKRNATHGLQLSRNDKEHYARVRYHAEPQKTRDALKLALKKLLSVSDKTLYNWLNRIDKDAKEANQKKAFALWLACETQEEIAEALDVPRQTIADWLKTFAEISNLAESGKAASSHMVDFDLPIYNVWKQQEKTAGSSHFGNSEVRWLDNLLSLYTQPSVLTRITKLS